MPNVQARVSVTDTRIIFLNISELAVQSDMRSKKEAGVPLLAPSYMTYITARPRALAHLDVLSSLPQLTPQFSRWLKESKYYVGVHMHELLNRVAPKRAVGVCQELKGLDFRWYPTR
ncbi:hypothetical protein BDR05DRAFT_1006172 [Suillus weaverae]|nr:hypothetical protein BDR05DRAFT_1006172 [Suillus weaverae]